MPAQENLRTKIRDLDEKIQQDLTVMLGSDSLLKGTLCHTTTLCGKPNCRCAKGERHSVWSFSYPNEEGRLTKITLNQERLNHYKGPAEDYRTFRKARARAAKRHRDLFHLLNQLEESLLIEIPEPSTGLPKGKTRSTKVDQSKRKDK